MEAFIEIHTIWQRILARNSRINLIVQCPTFDDIDRKKKKWEKVIELKMENLKDIVQLRELLKEKEEHENER